MALTVIDGLLWYLRRSGVTPPGIERIRPELHRWARHQQNRGVTVVPDLCYKRWWSFEETLAGNEINMLLSQFADDQVTAHQLRNLTGIRPYKV